MVCVLAVVAICLSNLPVPAIAATIVSLGILAGVQFHRYGHPRFVRIAGSEVGWQLLDRRNGGIPAVLQRHVKLGPFVQLHFLAERRHRHFLVTPDNVDADTRRRLHLLLARITPV